jgi:putative transcriptional regulator
MTTIRHHITDNLLMGYAAGALPRAFDLVIATHVSLSDDARARLAGYEAIGGAILEDVDAVELGDESLDLTLTRIKGMPASEISPTTTRGIFPSPLQAAVGGGVDAVKWRSLGMGTRQCVLHADKDASARLLYIPAGQAMPQHSHRGTEMTLVLQGAYRDESDRFARGDIELADQDMNHTPVAEAGEDCICLIATDAPLRFSGLLPRIAQPFLGI